MKEDLKTSNLMLSAAHLRSIILNEILTGPQKDLAGASTNIDLV